VPTLVLVSGEEEFLIEQSAREEARHSLADEVLEYRFPADADNYAEEARSPLMSGGKRAFIIWGPKEIPDLPEADDDVLIVITKKQLSDPRAKRNLQFPKLKAYADNNEVVGWILKEGERHNIDLSRVAGALFVNSGNCLRKLASEIEKLSWAVPPGTIVSPDVARPLMCFSAELTPKEIVDSICDGLTVRALAFYDKLQERADETGWILAYMQRHVLQQLKFEKLLERKPPYDGASSILGVHPFIFKRMLITRRGLWTKESLLKSLDTLCRLDILHKRGDESARFGLELEIIRLSEEARDVKH